VNAVSSVSAVQADCLKAAPDHHCDLRLGLRHGLRHGPEYLSDAAGGLDVADANLQMPFAGVAAADEGRVYSDSDRRHGSRRLGYGGVAELLTSFQRVAS
jgi:hypothetical protein